LSPLVVVLVAAADRRRRVQLEALQPALIRLGYKASAEQFGPGELRDFAIAAEANGFDSVFVSDHFQPWRHSDGHAPFAFAWLAAVGERTTRVTLGTSVSRRRFAITRRSSRRPLERWDRFIQVA